MQFPVMLLTSNDYRQSETEKEPHNLLLDFRGEWGPPGSDAGLRLNAQLPYPVGPPLASPQTKQRPDQSLKPYNAALLDDVEDIEGAPADYKYLPHKLLEALDALEPELGPDFAHYHSGGCLGAVTLQRTVYLVWPHCGGLLQFWSPTGEGFSVGGLPPDPVLGLEAYSSPKECWIVLRAKLQVLVLSVAEPRAYRVAYSECSRAPFLDAQLQGQLLGLVQLGKGFSLKDIGGPRVAFRLAASEVRKFAFAPPNRVVLMEPWLVTVHDFAEKTLLQRFDPQLMACNQLCNLRMAGGNLLLATRHYLLAAPLDCLEGFGAFAHGLSSAPLHLEALGALVCLGGRWGAVAFVEGTPFGLPCPLPSLKDINNSPVERVGPKSLKGFLWRFTPPNPLNYPPVCDLRMVLLRVNMERIRHLVQQRKHPGDFLEKRPLSTQGGLRSENCFKTKPAMSKRSLLQRSLTLQLKGIFGGPQSPTRGNPQEIIQRGFHCLHNGASRRSLTLRLKGIFGGPQSPTRAPPEATPQRSFKEGFVVYKTAPLERSLLENRADNGQNKSPHICQKPQKMTTLFCP
ncbi:hypothetical protein HUJ05_011241 [Dendroctonus ponderosae]|nr:hypothetical protein HUJ05_011241 [Dendroctonus ponderosae]